VPAKYAVHRVEEGISRVIGRRSIHLESIKLLDRFFGEGILFTQDTDVTLDFLVKLDLYWIAMYFNLETKCGAIRSSNAFDTCPGMCLDRDTHFTTDHHLMSLLMNTTEYIYHYPEAFAVSLRVTQ